MVVKKSNKGDYAYAASAEGSDVYHEESKLPLIGGLRIAKVTYEHHPIRQSPDAHHSIGALVDNHLQNLINNGELVSEVSLFFETTEQQEAVANMYRRRDY